MRIVKRPLTTSSSSSSSALSAAISHGGGGRRFWAAAGLVAVIGSLSSLPLSKAAAATTRNNNNNGCGGRSSSTPTGRTTTTTTAMTELAESQLLFWSLHDCALDAALQFLGPIDIFLRGVHVASAAASPKIGDDDDDDQVDDEGNNQWALFTSPSIHSTNNASVEDDVCEDDEDDNRGSNEPEEEDEGRLGQQQQQQQHAQHSSVQASLFAKGRAIVRDLKKNASISSSFYSASTTTSVDSTAFDDASSSASSSSLVVRGGAGPGAWRGISSSGSGKYVFSLFQKGDGSETDPDGLPKRYLDMHGGNRDLAKSSLQATLEWRREYNIDSILRDPHPKYDICKQVFPHYFLGRGSNDDRVILLQRPALLNMKMAEQNKLTKQQLLMHYVYVNEYLWQVVEASSPLQMMTSVIDLSGLDLSVLRQRENIAFLKLFVATMDSHYPQRAHKTLILNAPKWFSTLYKLLSPFLRDATKAKIEIHARGTKKQDEAIRKYIGASAMDVLPRSFFSSSSSSDSVSTKTASSALPFWKRKRQEALVLLPQETNSAEDEDNGGDDDDDDDDNNNNDAMVDEEGSLAAAINTDRDQNHKKKKNKKKKLTREEEKERLRNEATPIVSRLEDDLRAFVSLFELLLLLLLVLLASVCLMCVCV
jgi:CRAL/TRIO domain